MTDLGLSPKEFWSLTWYEWGMYVWKIYKDSKRELAQRELSIELTRSFMALFANANRDSKQKPSPFLPTDFFKLSYDTQLIQEADPEMFNRIARKLGSRIKGKQGNE